MKTSREIDKVQFLSSFVDSLSADPNSENIPRQVLGAHYTRVQPTPVKDPQLVAWSDDVATLLELSRPLARGPGANLLSGNFQTPEMKPFAACYGGHQFGHWAGQLGDGRAIGLGEIQNSSGQRFEIQLKGAGPTPYSRRADGRAVLRSSIREFLCSEAMFYLGIPTTRALSLCLTGEEVVRDMFYDGNPKAEPGAVVARVAPNFIRFGNFEILSSRGDLENLKKLVAFVAGQSTPLAWFEELCRKTARLMVEWMRVGFVHGVMNTDNMSTLGLTIDYGPYGWLEVYDPAWTPNTTDSAGRRYCYGNQPSIAQWNLAQLAEALAPLFVDPQVLAKALELYHSEFTSGYVTMMGEKIGLKLSNNEADWRFVTELDEALRAHETDWTLFFRNLAKVDPVLFLQAPKINLAPLIPAFYDETTLSHEALLIQWLRKWAERLGAAKQDPRARVQQMNRVNPKYVLRNYLVYQAIEAAHQGQYAQISKLLEVMKHPYDEQPEFEAFAAQMPDWARRTPGSSSLSCSS